MRRFFVSVFLAVFLVFDFGLRCAFAQMYGPIIAQANVNVPYFSQNTSEWCWVAVSEMVAAYFVPNVPSQCGMLQLAYRAPCCSNPTLCTVPGSIQQVQQLIQGFGLQTSQIGPPANGYVLLNLFQQGHPIVIHLNIGHFVVATGITVYMTAQGPLGVVHILDPELGPLDIPLPALDQNWDVGVYVM